MGHNRAGDTSRRTRRRRRKELVRLALKKQGGRKPTSIVSEVVGAIKAAGETIKEVVMPSKPKRFPSGKETS